MSDEMKRRLSIAAIELPDSDRYLAGDYMRENPMYSANEVRELIFAEREACAALVEAHQQAQLATTYDWTRRIGQDIAAAVRERSNVK